MFWPLNKKVFASGQRMKQVQPEVEKIKLKYGNDKSKAQEMQLEIWNVYKKNNVNPMGSCLPLLLQMPIFFALYGALNHSLDLYQAPFVGWITDLSSPDSFYIFPILWTLSLLSYFKINPRQPTQPGAPDMKWIMIGMNIFIGYLSKDWPSGLTLYLFVSNLVGILQQVMMLRSGKKLLPVQEGV
jgi:YidC/Oxa1 family membrane protein insertase